jgi:6-phosphogluconate dehydrogenase
MWRGGCIIRSVFLGNIKAAFDKNPQLDNLLLDDFFRDAVEKCQASWRKVVATAVLAGVPTPCFSTALAFYDGYRYSIFPEKCHSAFCAICNCVLVTSFFCSNRVTKSAISFPVRSGRLPANLIQAQRDYFGAHTYERLDAPGKFVHTNWTGTGGNVSSTAYNA